MNYRFGDCSLDTGCLELRRNGELVALEPQVFRLIVFLLESRDRVVTRDELIEAVWQRRIVSDSALNTCMNSARHALGDDGRRQEVIRTLPRQGFRFVADITETEAVPGVPNAAPMSLPDKPSIAVLPFENLSGDPEQEYFADGMAEDLITDISKIAGLFVAARNSSFAFKNRSIDVKEIAESLRVKHLLEGSVRKMGPKLRVNAQLIDASSGGHVWAERYDGHMANIFEFQDAIREQIVSALKVSLTAADRALAERKPTGSVAAYDFFLKGRASFHRFTADHLFHAKQCFEAAIEIDSNFADAYGYLAYCLFYAWFELLPGYEDGLRRANELAEWGVALDSGSAIAVGNLGWIQTYLRRHDQAILNFERAIRLAPNNAEVLANFGQVLNYYGNPERALEVIERAISLDTIAPPLWESYAGHSYLLLGRYDEAVERLLAATEQIPKFTAAFLRLAIAYQEMGRISEANDTIRKVLEISPRCNVGEVVKHYPYRLERVCNRFIGSLREAGMPET